MLELSSESGSSGDWYLDSRSAEGRNPPAGDEAGCQTGCTSQTRRPPNTFAGGAKQPVLRAHEAGSPDSADAPDRRISSGSSLSRLVTVGGPPVLRGLLSVVLDPCSRQCLLQPGRCSPQRQVPAAVASDNGACPGEETGGVGILRGGAVVDARYREPAIRREQQSQSAAHAVADHADPATAGLPVLQPGTRGLDVGEHSATPGARVAHD